ncbi:MAG: hypothetical protein NVS3B19_09130 [Ginsengibacter sp.]
MVSSEFSYDKKQVIQALRYHFITRREIKAMIILVNVFTLVSVALFFFKRISPVAFLISSFLWFSIMIAFWFILPFSIYRSAPTFKDHFTVNLEEGHLFLENEKGSKSWTWKQFRTFMESPYFFYLYLNSRAFFLIPKSAFQKEELHNVREILKEKIIKH